MRFRETRSAKTLSSQTAPASMCTLARESFLRANGYVDGSRQSMWRVVQLVNSGIEHRPRHRHSGHIVTLVREPVTGIVEITACVGVVSSVGACQYPLQEPSHHHLGNRFQPYQARGLTGKRVRWNSHLIGSREALQPLGFGMLLIARPPPRLYRTVRRTLLANGVLWRMLTCGSAGYFRHHRERQAVHYS